MEKLTIEINTKCFNKCVHCSAFEPGNIPNKQMEHRDIENLVDKFVDLGGKEINISGGEPLLHPHITDIVNYCKEKQLIVNIFTCGIFSETYDEKIMKQYVKKISECNIDEIMVTLHSSYAENHDDITERQDSFENAVEFIKNLLDDNQNICVHFVPMHINSEELEDLVDFLVYMKIKKIQVLRFIPQGRGLKNRDWLSLPMDANINLMNTIRKISKRDDITINLGHPGDFRFLLEKTHLPKPCTAGISQCMILVNGDVIPCPAFGDLNNWIAGNLFQVELDQLWDSSEVFNALREFNYLDLKGECSECEHLHPCHGRCPAERIRENGDLYQGPDPSCPKDAVKRPTT